MEIINVHEAKTHLSRLLQRVEAGQLWVAEQPEEKTVIRQRAGPRRPAEDGLPVTQVA